MTGRRGRLLTSGERRLWAEIARSVAPLPGKRPPEPEPVPAPAEQVSRTVQPSLPSPKPEKPRPKPLAPVEAKTVRALARGTRAPDAVIDLHGLTQAEAHRALAGFLGRSQRAGHRVVLVVTGKGRVSDGPEPAERGILRRMVPHWLSLPAAREIVLGWQEAGPRQGGAGALYVRLRRATGGA